MSLDFPRTKYSLILSTEIKINRTFLLFCFWDFSFSLLFHLSIYDGRMRGVRLRTYEFCNGQIYPKLVVYLNHLPPPPPSSVLLAALAMASISKVVMSPFQTDTLLLISSFTGYSLGSFFFETVTYLN